MPQQALVPSQCRAARGLLAWTQDVLAARAGVSRSTVRDFENGRHDLHRSTACQIARTLEEAGVMLIAGGEFGPGVRLRRPEMPAIVAGAGCGS